MDAIGIVKKNRVNRCGEDKVWNENNLHDGRPLPGCVPEPSQFDNNEQLYRNSNNSYNLITNKCILEDSDSYLTGVQILRLRREEEGNVTG